MIAALGAASFLPPAHVKDFYMSRLERSLILRPLTGVHQD
jgi:hypothetical protein